MDQKNLAGFSLLRFVVVSYHYDRCCEHLAASGYFYHCCCFWYSVDIVDEGAGHQFVETGVL